MIQLYAYIDDLIPTEPYNWLFENGETMQGRIKKYEQSIIEGWLTSKKINPDGTLAKGNASYYIAKKHNINYIPVNLQWFLGMEYYERGKTLSIRPEVLGYFTSKIGSKKDIQIQNMKDYPLVRPPTGIKELFQFTYQMNLLFDTWNRQLYPNSHLEICRQHIDK